MSNEQEEFRLCPTCRMSISIWATKCRYCGEPVGRPKKEESHFTVKDLGGQPQKVYTLSGNVTDALESFRVDEATVSSDEKKVQEEKRQSWLSRLRKGRVTATSTPGEPALPELDEYHRSLTSMLDQPSTTSRSRLPAGPSLLERLLKLGVIVLALVILGFTADFAWARINAYIAAKNYVPEEIYNNRAGIWLEQGDVASIDILIEAQTAVGVNDTAENRAILDRARKRFTAEIEGLLARNPFRKENLDQASSLMSRATTNAGPEILKLNDEVRLEIAYYNMTPTVIGDNTATFRLNNPAFAKSEQVVSQNDLVQDRFLVKRITRGYVVLEDTKAPGGAGRRNLEVELFGYPRGR